jgi:hypothetical protein
MAREVKAGEVMAMILSDRTVHSTGCHWAEDLQEQGQPVQAVDDLRRTHGHQFGMPGHRRRAILQTRSTL